MKELIPHESIEQRIFNIRGQKVMLDRDLAGLYGVATKVLNQAIRRNIKRFPDDFMFKLTQPEKNELVTNCDRFRTLKHSTVTPYAFTEQGVAMLSTVLNSERAIQVNIAIMRTFVKLRQLSYTHKEFAHKLNELERKMGKHDEDIKVIFEAIRQLMAPPEKPRKRIGFKREIES
ncbi:MAG: ORF6N domain-containing protein [Nitrospirota bacterium]